jgi:hypothetical protein
VAGRREGYRTRRLAARRSRRWGAYQNLVLYALAAVVAFGSVLGAVHLAHALRQHHVLPSKASYLALVTIGGQSGTRTTAAVLVHNAALEQTTLYTLPSDLLLTDASGEYVMAGDVAAEGELKPYLERLFNAHLSYRLELTYGDLARLAGDHDLWVTAATSFSLQTGDAIRLFNGRFSLPASQLATVLSASGKGNTDQANAQVAFLSAALSSAALVPAQQRAAAIEQIAKRQKTLTSADARDLLGTLVSGRTTVTRVPSDGQVSYGQFAWRPDPAAITAQITRNARDFDAPYTVAVENGSGAIGIGAMVDDRLAGLNVNLPAVRNAASFDYSVTQILAGAKAFGVANQVRGILGHGVVLTGNGLPDTTVVVIVGKDLKAKDLQ